MRISDWSSDVCSSDLPERRRHRDREGAGTQRGEAAAAVAPGPALRSYQVIETHRFSIAALPTRVSRTRRLNRRYIAGLLRPGALRSEEHTSELQSLMRISYAVFCLKKKHNKQSKN